MLMEATEVTTQAVGTDLINGRERDYGSVLWKQPHLLDLSYSELEVRNLEIKELREAGKTSDEVKGKMMEYLEGEMGIKAVMVCFSDLEGRLHSLDYDKKFILGAEDNLTFDGSSINGFTSLAESDLRLKVDWTSFRWVPSDLFGAGKVMVFGNVCNRDGSLYHSDFRSRLMSLCHDLAKEGIKTNVAPEVEGFLFKGEKAEQIFDEKKGFELATATGYFSSLPQDTLRLFIDKFAEVQRAMAFENEKDHPEVAPAQFELNFRYGNALDTADQIQIYKLLAKQVAQSMGFTASFLPKPIQNLNGSGMHTNMSLAKDGKNIFFDGADEHKVSADAHKFITGILCRANDLCLIMNASVNSYRRLDPNYEAPNEIMFSSVNRGAMIRIPEGNEKSARVEVRTVAPDANPYMVMFTLFSAGLEGMKMSDSELKAAKAKVYKGRVKKLPADIYVAMEHFRKSKYMKGLLSEEDHGKYLELKAESAHRAPRALGSKVKAEEILYHHEITNQLLWDDF